MTTKAAVCATERPASSAALWSRSSSSAACLAPQLVRSETVAARVPLDETRNAPGTLQDDQIRPVRTRTNTYTDGYENRGNPRNSAHRGIGPVNRESLQLFLVRVQVPQRKTREDSRVFSVSGRVLTSVGGRPGHQGDARHAAAARRGAVPRAPRARRSPRHPSASSC